LSNIGYVVLYCVEFVHSPVHRNAVLLLTDCLAVQLFYSAGVAIGLTIIFVKPRKETGNKRIRLVFSLRVPIENNC